jgi:heat shock protein HslJ
MKIYSLFLFCYMLLFISCKQNEPTTPATSISTIIGKWKLTGVLLGDVIDGPCTANSQTRDITLEITATPSGVGSSLKMTGQSVVNNYFAYYEANANGSIKIPNVGTTEIAGTSAMMECEARYYQLLGASEEYRIENDNGKTILQLGIFKKPNTPPSKNNGTYLIYEKID